MAKIGLDSNPTFSQMSTDEIVRSRAIVVQIIGKAFGGGCHEGLFLSLKTGSSLEAEGLELLRGENTRERTAMKRKNAPTKAFLAT